MSSPASFGLSNTGVTPLSVTANCALQSATIEAGSIAVMDVSINNDTADQVEATVGVYVDGTLDSTDTVTIQANDEISYQTSIRGLSTGSYAVGAELESVEVIDGGNGDNGDPPCQCQGDGDCPTGFFCQDCICVPDRYRELVT